MSFEETAKDCWTIEQYMAAKRENATLKAQVKELREDLETEQRAFEGLNSRFESIKRQRNKLRAEKERLKHLDTYHNAEVRMLWNEIATLRGVPQLRVGEKFVDSEGITWVGADNNSREQNPPTTNGENDDE